MLNQQRGLMKLSEMSSAGAGCVKRSECNHCGTGKILSSARLELTTFRWRTQGLQCDCI